MNRTRFPVLPTTLPDFISNVNCITRNAPLYGAESMKFADFAACGLSALTGMVKTAMALAVMTILKGINAVKTH